MNKSPLTHFNAAGRGHMVEVTDKKDSHRRATAEAWVHMRKETLALIKEGKATKGDVLGVAQIAGIMGAKKTSDLIPMCHPLALTGVDMNFEFGENCIRVEGTVTTFGKTGVEMEALSAVSIAALTIYDMCKAVDKGMAIDGIALLSKTGGKSGEYKRGE